MLAFALKLENGRWAKSSVGTPVWYADRQRAEDVNRLYWGESAKVTEVRMERSPYAYNGYEVKD